MNDTNNFVCAKRKRKTKTHLGGCESIDEIVCVGDTDSDMADGDDDASDTGDDDDDVDDDDDDVLVALVDVVVITDSNNDDADGDDNADDGAATDDAFELYVEFVVVDDVADDEDDGGFSNKSLADKDTRQIAKLDSINETKNETNQPDVNRQ